MDRLSQEQIRRNIAADHTWAPYTSHRNRVTTLLQSSCRDSSDRLLILGAGNLNDVDVSALLATYREITLVDLDASAVARGLARQGLADNPRILKRTPIDLTGAFELLSRLASKEAADADLIELCLQKLAQVPNVAAESSSDVVASVGLLTQLIEAVVIAVGEGHPRFWDLVSAVRTQHLRMMMEMTQPSGSAVLITEIVSSNSCRELLSIDEAGLPELLRREIAAGNFFTGINPAAIRRSLETEPAVSQHACDIAFAPPWLWTFISRTYAVYSMTIRKRA